MVPSSWIIQHHLTVVRFVVVVVVVAALTLVVIINQRIDAFENPTLLTGRHRYFRHCDHDRPRRIGRDQLLPLSVSPDGKSTTTTNAITTTTPSSTTPSNGVRPQPPSYRDRSVVASQRLGVRLSRFDFPPWFWKLSWKVHSKSLPILHRWDTARTPDLDNCLKCLWCKAISSQDKSSPVYEPNGWTYDMLPSFTRRIILKNPFLPLWIFPRLVHYVIELRTTFLNRSLQNEIIKAQQQQESSNHGHESVSINDNDDKTNRRKNRRIRLISLGAGYDTRSVQFLNVNNIGDMENDDKNKMTSSPLYGIDEAYELDMPQVVTSKQVMFDRMVERRNRRNHRHGRSSNNDTQQATATTTSATTTIKVPTLMSQDLTDINGLIQRLDEIFDNDNDASNTAADNNDTTTTTVTTPCYTVFLVEGVLIYLSEVQRSAVLSTCSKYLTDRNLHGTLLFADRIRKPSDPTLDEMKQWLHDDGWLLDDESFTVHPGKARHMGIART
jgi:hypothetical protein